MKFIVFMMLVGVLGCATRQASVSDGVSTQSKMEKSEARESKAKSAYDIYVTCVLFSASRYMSSDATPTEIAAASHAGCQTQFARYTESLEDLFVLAVSVPSMPYALERARARAAITKTEISEMIIKQVLERRTQPKKPTFY